MNQRLVVASCAAGDWRFVDDVRAWASSGLLGDRVQVVGESRDPRDDDDDGARVARMRAWIGDAAAVLVLVGDHTHTQAWVDAQLAVATAASKDVLCVRLPRTAGPAPRGLGHAPLLAFEPRAMRCALAPLW